MIPVILCGGDGTRLWPASRETHPKTLIRLADGQSLVQKAFLRAAALADVQEVLTVTNRQTYQPIKAACDEVNQAGTPLSFLLEPSARNTAAAIAAAALWVSQHHGVQALMLVLPADHLIEPQAEFAQAVARATPAAQQGRIVTFGMVPTRAETGYGYIEFEQEFQAFEGVHAVQQFVEKPAQALAEQLLAGGRHLWNAGIFMFTAGTMLSEFAVHAPDVLAQVEAAFSAADRVAGGGAHSLVLNPEAFARVRRISIDYAILEKSRLVSVVPSHMGWSDIGSWPTLAALTPADEQGNRLHGQVVLHGARNCYIDSPHRLTAAVGVDNLVIVDTPDALLVAHAGQAQDVREIVAQLKALNHPAGSRHVQTEEAWGSSVQIDATGPCETHRVTVRPGTVWNSSRPASDSEHWLVLQGQGELRSDDKVQSLRGPQVALFHAPPSCAVHNTSSQDLVLLAIRQSAPTTKSAGT